MPIHIMKYCKKEEKNKTKYLQKQVQRGILYHFMITWLIVDINFQKQNDSFGQTNLLPDLETFKVAPIRHS